MKLHIQMEDFSIIVKDAYYDTFRIENEVCYEQLKSLFCNLFSILLYYQIRKVKRFKKIAWI